MILFKVNTRQVINNIAQMDKINFNADEYIKFLGLLISESEYLQNGDKCIAEETRAANHVINYLQPHIDNNKIRFNKVEYVTGRANLIIEYGDDDLQETLTIAGSHFDVVPADPNEWERNPFELIIEGCY